MKRSPILRKAAAAAASKLDTPEVPKDFDLGMLEIDANGPMFDPSRPLNLLAPRIIAKDLQGNVLGSVLQLNLFTGDGLQVERDADGNPTYDENGHPQFRLVKVARVEIDIPPR